MVNWEFFFSNKSVCEQVYISKNALMNVFFNYFSNKFMTIVVKGPPWMSEKIKIKIKQKNLICSPIFQVANLPLITKNLPCSLL